MKHLTLVKGFDRVYVGFRPDDMGVTVVFNGRTYHPEWRLVSDMPISLDVYGPPECWCTDGRFVYFDKRAKDDYAVEVAEPAPKVKKPGFFASIIARIRKEIT